MFPKLTLKDSILYKTGSSYLFPCRKAVTCPDPSHVILSNRHVHSQKFHRFGSVRKTLAFRIRDSSFVSLLRMYELVLCGLDDELALEAEYFWTRKWKVNRISDPTHSGWELDLERDRICQAIVAILVDSFNCHADISGRRPCQRIPKWAKSEKRMEPVELCQHYPSLGRLYFFLPWKRLWFVRPPCDFRVIEYKWSYFVNWYQHHSKLTSLPLFKLKDTHLASFCRLYELNSLYDCLSQSELLDQDELENFLTAYYDEKQYFFARPERVASIPDPRKRWYRVEIREPDTFKEMVEFARTLAKMEAGRHGGVPVFPLWARD